jgi:hypothetical protein
MASRSLRTPVGELELAGEAPTGGISCSLRGARGGREPRKTLVADALGVHLPELELRGPSVEEIVGVFVDILREKAPSFS